MQKAHLQLYPELLKLKKSLIIDQQREVRLKKWSTQHLTPSSILQLRLVHISSFLRQRSLNLVDLARSSIDCSLSFQQIYLIYFILLFLPMNKLQISNLSKFFASLLVLCCLVSAYPELSYQGQYLEFQSGTIELSASAGRITSMRGDSVSMWHYTQTYRKERQAIPMVLLGIRSVDTERDAAEGAWMVSPPTASTLGFSFTLSASSSFSPPVRLAFLLLFGPTPLFHLTYFSLPISPALHNHHKNDIKSTSLKLPSARWESLSEEEVAVFVWLMGWERRRVVGMQGKWRGRGEGRVVIESEVKEWRKVEAEGTDIEIGEVGVGVLVVDRILLYRINYTLHVDSFSDQIGSQDFPGTESSFIFLSSHTIWGYLVFIKRTCTSMLDMKTGSCLSACPELSYKSDGLCLPCSHMCLSCIAHPSLHSLCLNCTEGWTLMDGRCLSRLLTANFDCTTANYSLLMPHALLCYYDGSTLKPYSCADSYLVASNLLSCVRCPSILCRTCDSQKCLTCFDSTFSLTTTTPTLCACKNNNFPSLDQNQPKCQACSSVIGHCSSCYLSPTNSSVTLCNSCQNGYLLIPNKTDCLGCPLYCTTCLNYTTCTVCNPTFILVAGQCICNSTAGLYFDPVTYTCLTCGLVISGCLNCSSTTTTTTACLTCSLSYYIDATFSCSPCLAYCLNCTNSSTCITCDPTFIYNGTACVCPATYVLNTTTDSCVLCAVTYPACTACTNVTGTLVCTDCSYGMYPAANSTCVECLYVCLDCTSSAVCTACISTFVLVSGKCVCNNTAGLYYNTATISCLLCGSTIFGCTTCVNNVNTTTTCSDCVAGYYPSGSLCLACPTVCADCSGPTTGCICETGLTWNGLTCVCSSGSCLSCNTTIAYCTTCNSTPTCLTCAPTYYLVSNSCQPCSALSLNCLECTPTACTSCLSPYLYNGAGSCICDVSLGYYFNLAKTSCVTCNTSIPFCLLCLSTASLDTVCSDCQTGYYLSTNQSCLICPSSCGDCTTASNCLYCRPTFTLINGSCLCDNAAGYFYSLTADLCLACWELVPLCTTCSNLTVTTYDCVLCQDGYYPSAGPVCIACSSNCVTCSTSSNCLTCPPTFLPTPVNGSCVCDIAGGLYPSSYLSLCDSCGNLINYCLSCTYTTFLTCASCAPETYLSGTVCLLCPPYCYSCTNATACTSCDSGYTLSGGTCICSITCSTCLANITSCVACALNGSTLECQACTPGTFLVGTMFCQACPSACLDCNSLTSCTLCQPTFTLYNGMCICQAAESLFLYLGSCVDCSLIFSGCGLCTDSPALACVSCQDGYYMSATGCLPCNITCGTCTNATSCVTCDIGLTLNNGTCECDAVCQLCWTASTSCTSCIFNATVLLQCLDCQPGLYLSTTTTCSPCPTSCLTCAANTSCLTCNATFTVVNGTCTCAVEAGWFYNKLTFQCQLCSTITVSCLTCGYGGALLNNVTCLACVTGYFPSSDICFQCIPGCFSCNSSADCMVCNSPEYILNASSVCVCNAAANYFPNTTYPTLCTLCNLTLCVNCLSLTTCDNCTFSAYLNSSNLCSPTVCGDSLITSAETCDDGNNVSGDGCGSTCVVEVLYICVGLPSNCTLAATLAVELHTVVSSSCNELQIGWKITPIYDGYVTAQWNNFLAVLNEPSLVLNTVSYANGVVKAKFKLTANAQGKIVGFMMFPDQIGVTEIAAFSYYIDYVAILPINSPAYLYPLQVCQSQSSLNTLTQVLQYGSYGALLLSALPCKIVGLQLFGVLQLAFFSLGSMDNLNVLMTPMLGLKTTNGLTLELDHRSDSPSRKARLLQETPSRIQTLDYSANFLRNCNVMLAVVILVLILSSIVYVIAFCLRSCPSLWACSRRAIKEVLLTLVLFNCFNFAYSAGLHFLYADNSDPLYLYGTLAAVGSLCLMVGVGVGLMVTEQTGFGEFKDKLKDGCVEKGYFVVTIVYRMGVGLYLSSKNSEELSTLLVLAFSLLWLLYNLVNLPFRRAFHNYRANICHLTHFICLFIAMYYRSMKSTSDPLAVAFIFSPLYLEYTCISISLVISLIVLFYEIYLFVQECRKGKEEKKLVEEKRASLSNLNEHNETFGNMELQKQENGSLSIEMN